MKKILNIAGLIVSAISLFIAFALGVPTIYIHYETTIITIVIMMLASLIINALSLIKAVIDKDKLLKGVSLIGTLIFVVIVCDCFSHVFINYTFSIIGLITNPFNSPFTFLSILVFVLNVILLIIANKNVFIQKPKS